MRVGIRCALAVYCALAPVCALSAAGKVFRCVADDGHISYQQFACAFGSEPMKIQRRPSGWTPLRPGEKRLLEAYRSKAAALPPPGTSPAKGPTREALACWKREKQLDALRAQLRRGYTVGEGQRLRRRSAEHRDYLRRFCP